MLGKLVLFSSLLVSLAGYAQPYGFIPLKVGKHKEGADGYSEHWQKGRMVGEGGDTIKCKIDYQLIENTIMAEKSGYVERFTADQIFYFEVTDQSLWKNRKFYSLPYSKNGSQIVLTFFEQIAAGEMTLLYREPNFFIRRGSASIEIFNGDEDDLLAMMGEKGSMVDKYMRRKNLQVKNRKDFAKIVAYYNSL